MPEQHLDGLTDKLQDQRRRECAAGDTGIVCEAGVLVHMAAAVPVAGHLALVRSCRTERERIRKLNGCSCDCLCDLLLWWRRQYIGVQLLVRPPRVTFAYSLGGACPAGLVYLFLNYPCSLRTERPWK